MASSLPNNPFEDRHCLARFGSHGRLDTSKSEMKQTEDFLASEMQKLSVQEREAAFDDVHCVGDEIQETPEMIQRSLADFEEVVQKERNPVYEVAMNQNRTYVENPTFRLKFLRAKLHNVGEAVRQMMTFLECKAKYFGLDKVARDISLDDLSEEDKKLMTSGLFHIQDERDRKGRVVLHMFGKMLSRCKADVMIRMSYYIYFNLLVSLPIVQRKGVVAVYNDTTLPGEKFAIPTFKFVRETQLFFDSVPIRYSGMHFCLQTKRQHLVLNNVLSSLFLNGLPRYVRVRTRIHYGSLVELQYQLRSYGVPLATFPFDVHGNIRADILNLWFDKHLEEINQSAPFQQPEVTLSSPEHFGIDSLPLHQPRLDSMSGSTESAAPGQVSDQAWASIEEDATAQDKCATGTILPSEMDVLFGKGYRLQSHPGNIRFRDFLEQHRDEYESTPRLKRREVAIEFAHMFRNNGVRFLQKTEYGEWMESDMGQAEKKVAQYFRELRKKRSKGRR